jgi:hypothetical protein
MLLQGLSYQKSRRHLMQAICAIGDCQGTRDEKSRIICPKENLLDCIKIHIAFLLAGLAEIGGG